VGAVYLRGQRCAAAALASKSRPSIEATLRAKKLPEGLKTYAEKRDFSRTSEPKPAAPVEQGSRFVVQKHAARRLHYDLRLELDGTLLSWAVPEGPSFAPTVKRLAVRTEDHPLEYLEFEGVIPKGEYGGGTMIVWDRGDWKPVADPRKGLQKGHIEFELDGRRLKGRWHLVRMKPRPRETKEQWLLIKAKDGYAREPDAGSVVEDETTSVLSGRTNADLAATDSVRADHKGRANAAARTPVSLPGLRGVNGARKGLLRAFVEPMLASPADGPPKGERWRHEVKFDGYRMQARIDGDNVRLLTRKGLDWTNRFSAVAEALRELALGSAVLDGEIVAEDSAGVSKFSELVADLKAGRQDRFRYYAFDCLYLDGTDLTGATFADRKRILGAVLSSRPHSDRLVLSEDFAIEGDLFFEHVSRLGLEGMISKRAASAYRSGRTGDWLKSKCILAQEFVVVGFTPSSTSRRAIGSLVLGYYRAGDLVYAGRVGTGFTEEETKALFAALDPSRIDTPLFPRKVPAEAAKGVRWVEPRLVAQVDYQGWTADGLVWHGVFKGLRDDKDVREIVREGEATAPSASKPVAGLTHPERLLWPAEGVTKQGLADYYAGAAEWVLPHLVGRPLSLVRCPNGVAADCFFAKQPWAGLSDAVQRISIGEGAKALAIDSLEGLIALVQGAVLEIHPWGSSIKSLERPDRLIFDLDPGDDVPWASTIVAALEVRERLKSALGLESFVKTTGGKGLHVVAPLTPSIDWSEATAISKSVAESMARDSPERYVAKMAKVARKGKVFVDYLRNARGATAVGAYSTRARPTAAVSTPLEWSELSEAVRSDHYRLSNIDRRLSNLRRNPWEGFFAIRQAPRPEAASRRAAGKKVEDRH
jgi:bifunctional non-homologous end joining protein LigD